MRPLSKKKINRMLLEREITAILDEFQEKQPEIYQAIYGEPSDAIAEENPEMASMYLEWCFDVIWIYRSAFGKPPVVPDRKQLVLNALSLLDLELKSLCDDVQMDEAFRTNLQKRFIDRSVEAGVQIELLQYLVGEVKKYASSKEEWIAMINA